MILPGIYNQGVRTPDCWIHATKWAAEASRPGIDQPTVTEFRAFALDPRDGISDGGSLTEVVRGARGSYPGLEIVRFEDRFAALDRLLSAGRPASVALWSGKLPIALRFGFNGAHQVGVVRDRGTTYLANPLAREGTPPVPITTAALQTAMTASELGYGGDVRAAIFPAPTEADMPGLKVTLLGDKTISGVFRSKIDSSAIYLHDRSQRDLVTAGRPFQALSAYERDWDNARGYVITESRMPSWISANAGTFTPDPPRASAIADFNAGVDAAVAQAATARRS